MSLLLLFSGSAAPSNAIFLPSVGDVATLNAPEINTSASYEMASLGDVATINAPTVTWYYTLPLTTLGDVATLNGPNVFEYDVLPLPSIGGGPVPGGLWIEIAEEAPPTPTPGEPIPASLDIADPRVVVRVVEEADPSTVLVTLDHPLAPQWEDVVGDAGTGTCVLENDDAQVGDATYGRMLRFEQDGRAVFLAQITRREQVVLAQDEEVAEVTTVGGPGALELWSNGIVYPEAGARGKPVGDQRLLDWTSADFDDDGWRTVVVGGKIGGHHANAAAAGSPVSAAGFPDGEAHILWAYSSTGAGGAGAGGVPAGLAYFRKTFTVATAGWHRLFVSADDGINVVIDGVPIFAEARLWFHLETKFVDVYLSAGSHQMAIRGENLDNGNLAGNSAWVLGSLYSIDEDGNLVSVVVRTDSTWKGVAFPPKPPGMTIGRAIRVLLEEAQARGALLGWTLAFTDNADSAGQGWGDDPALSFQHGMDLYAVLKQLAETYCELDTAPAQLVLYAYIDGFGDETSIEYQEGESILALSHEGVG